jgi:hypothetical protein
MADTQFIPVKRQSIVDGSWYDLARHHWARGEVALLEIEPEPSGDPDLRAAVETMIHSNGSYQRGDRVVVHARPAGLTMGCETAHLLRERGMNARVILGLSSLAREVRGLLEAVYDQGTDFATAALEPLDGIFAGYRDLLGAIEREGRAHWVVTIGTAPDPDPADVAALDLFTRVAGRALAPLGALRNDGQILSHDIWLTPSQLDVDRLNEDLPRERHWSLEEWRRLIFHAMAVPAEELHDLALGIDGVRLTVQASLEGGRLRYQRADGTDFTYSVTGRPVILDCGSIGNNSLGGTTAFGSVITNQPTTEVFVAPIEDSLDGVIVYTIPERTVHGIIRAPYRIEVRSGRVTHVEAPDAESRKILRNYTGLEPYDGQPLAGEEAEAFDMRRVIAEMAIAGFNPAMIPAIQDGRLRPVTGLVLTDEKLGDHQAFGSNDQFKGGTPSTHGDHHVEHTDFVGSIQRTITRVI